MASRGEKKKNALLYTYFVPHERFFLSVKRKKDFEKKTFSTRRPCIEISAFKSLFYGRIERKSGQNWSKKKTKKCECLLCHMCVCVCFVQGKSTTTALLYNS